MIERILVAEDDLRFAAALKLLLDTHGLRSRFAPTGAAALEMLQQQRPDAFLVDLGLPDLDGEKLIEFARKRHAELPIIVLSVIDVAPRIVNAIKAGASGYLLKCDAAAKLLPALRSLEHGGVALSDLAARVVLGAMQAAADGPVTRNAVQEKLLSRRETQVLEVLARGYTYSDCATALDMSVNTLRTHVRTIYKKLEINSKTEAAREALRRGLVE